MTFVSSENCQITEEEKLDPNINFYIICCLFLVKIKNKHGDGINQKDPKRLLKTNVVVTPNNTNRAKIFAFSGWIERNRQKGRERKNLR